ncbi:MAG: ParB/RepB/Spo0J family partition protein [Rhizobiaceae bacterium]
MADDSKKRLGRGLAALIGEMDKPVAKLATGSSNIDVEIGATVASDRVVPIENIKANPNNPRRHFAESELEDLANSISEHGIVQPILVRPAPSGGDHWEIIAGERRWRAAQKSGLHQVPIVVRDVDDRQALELAIIENVQRADLNPVEEALGYQQLIDEHSYKQVDLGKVIGKSRSHVANTLRLLKLPSGVRELLTSGALSSGHARTLVTLDKPEALAKRIVSEGLSVRQAEQLAAIADRPEGLETKSTKGKLAKDADTIALEKRLSDALGLKIKIAHKVSGKGRLMIDYKSLEQLDDLVAKLSK